VGELPDWALQWSAGCGGSVSGFHDGYKIGRIGSAQGESQILHHTHMEDMHADVNKGSRAVHIMAGLTQFLIVQDNQFLIPTAAFKNILTKKS